MRRLLLGSLGALTLTVLLAVPAFAHPLGNFTVNHFTRVAIAGDRMRVLYILDMAEIPTFQEQQTIRDDPRYLDHKVAELGRGLHLSVDGQRTALRPVSRVLTFRPGQGGLQTLRLEAWFDAGAVEPGDRSGRVEDANYVGRLGWSEVVVDAAGGASVWGSSAPAASVSRELQSYPQDLLTSPLHMTTASFQFRPGAAAVQLPRLVGTPSGLAAFQDRFAALIEHGPGSPQLVALALLAALGLGILHALEPGHGKAVMAGYLVGTGGRRRDAVALGVTITATHTAGVFGLGAVVLLAAGLVTPERVYPWLTLASGLLVIGVGGALALRRVRELRHEGEHTHGHDHSHSHPHAHGQGRRLGRWGVVLLGISGGLIPCPAALVVLLAAMSLHQVAFGLLLIVAFSAGLAIALTGIGLLLAGGLPAVRRLAGRLRPGGAPGLVRLLPIASAVVVTALGIGLCAQALEVVL